MKKQLILIIMVFYCFLSSFPNQSKALDCAGYEGPAINQHNGAIVGTVLNVKKDVVQQGTSDLKETKKYVLIDVDRSWKIEVNSQLIFETDFTWGYNFEEGKKYLIYLNEDNGIYTNSPCSPVSVVNSSNEYEEILGASQKPKKTVNLDYKVWFMSDNHLGLIFSLVLIGLLIIFIWKWYSKRLKTKDGCQFS
jgi:hypothetical protein